MGRAVVSKTTGRGSNPRRPANYQYVFEYDDSRARVWPNSTGETLDVLFQNSPRVVRRVALMAPEEAWRLPDSAWPMAGAVPRSDDEVVYVSGTNLRWRKPRPEDKDESRKDVQLAKKRFRLGILQRLRKWWAEEKQDL